MRQIPSRLPRRCRFGWVHDVCHGAEREHVSPIREAEHEAQDHDQGWSEVWHAQQGKDAGS
jgi:HD superfamily phosphohydrolase YqeK